MSEEKGVAACHKRRAISPDLFGEEVVGQVGRADAKHRIRVATERQTCDSNFDARAQTIGTVDFPAKTDGRSHSMSPSANEGISKAPRRMISVLR